MSRLEILTILILLSLVACSLEETAIPKTAPPEASVTSTPMETDSPATSTVTSPGEAISRTQSVDSTEISIPEVPQLENGTYLVYLEEIDTGFELLFIKSDGSSIVTRHYPVLIPYSQDPIQGVSPDGRYFAYHSGNAGLWGDLRFDGEYGLQLNIVSLLGGTDVIEIPLLSESYPFNFLDLAETLESQHAEEIRTTTTEDTKAAVYDAFLQGIGSLEWSPDSRYLAFAGQMDGPSSDLYLFDTKDESIKRLTSGPGQIQRIAWSPDSTKIMHESTLWFGINPPFTNHLATIDDSKVISFPDDQGQIEVGWLNDDQYLVYEISKGFESHELRIFDAQNGAPRLLWPYPFLDVDCHTENGLILVTGAYSADAEIEPGAYLIDVNTAKFKQIETAGSAVGVEALDRDDYYFAVTTVRDGSYLISSEYEVEKISNKSWGIKSSPNQELLAIYGDNHNPGLEIFSFQDRSILSLINDDVGKVYWSPDTSGIFFLSDETLYLYDFSNRKFIQIVSYNDDERNWLGDFKFIQISP